MKRKKMVDNFLSSRCNDSEKMKKNLEIYFKRYEIIAKNFWYEILEVHKSNKFFQSYIFMIFQKNRKYFGKFFVDFAKIFKNLDHLKKWRKNDFFFNFFPNLQNYVIFAITILIILQNPKKKHSIDFTKIFW